jgi:hypothetical protein
MMGQHSGNQDRLFYSFNLDDHVPADHLLRGIDRFLDLADLRQHLAPFYSHTGQPSVDQFETFNSKGWTPRSRRSCALADVAGKNSSAS